MVDIPSFYAKTFTEVNTAWSFDKGAMFEQTRLIHVDFRTSFNYSIDSGKNQIQHAKFSREEIAGLLYK